MEEYEYEYTITLEYKTKDIQTTLRLTEEAFLSLYEVVTNTKKSLDKMKKEEENE